MKNNDNGNRNGKLVKAKQVKVKYQSISDGQLPDECVVTLNTTKGLIVTLLQSNYVDRSNETIPAIIVAQDNDQYLLDLPAATFSTGSKAWFGRESILVESKGKVV